MELEKDSKQVHLYNAEDVLKPRGTMKKESLGEHIFYRLDSIFEDWTDPKYADNPSADVLLMQMYENLQDEVSHAWESFATKLRKSNNDHITAFKMHLSLMGAKQAEPSMISSEVKYFLDKMIEDDVLFIEAICFIDRYERTSKEFKYFTAIHVLFMQNSEPYAQRMKEVSEEGTVLQKMMYEKIDK